MTRVRSAALSVLIGAIAEVLWSLFLVSGHSLAQQAGHFLVAMLKNVPTNWYPAVHNTLGYTFLPMLLAVLVYALVHKYFPRPAPEEARCRRCAYLLRGISKPQCPECGELV